MAVEPNDFFAFIQAVLNTEIIIMDAHNAILLPLRVEENDLSNS